jgi:RHS repeat-associated protein
LNIWIAPRGTGGLFCFNTVKYLPFGSCRNSPDLPTDKLFTGQRLDGTGLYYYNARYYDATIGRFISADSIIPHPANPQTLNRYSYCLNNPLKYTDPSGHIVEIMGWDVRVIYSLLATPNLIPELLAAVSDVAASKEFQAYNEFKIQTQEDSMRAYTLENSNSKTITVTFDNLGYQPDSTTDKKGNAYNIILNNNEYNDLSKADSFYTGREVSKQVENHVLDCYPSITSSLPHPIEYIPYGGELMYTDTIYRYRYNYISTMDFLVSTLSTGVGIFNPVLGYFAMAGETIYLFWQYSQDFYQNVSQNGYDFK